MNLKVPFHLRALLDEVCAKNGCHRSLEKMEGGEYSLEGNDREWLIDVLVQELLDTGLNVNDEPNGRGLDIEALIDVFGPGSGRSDESAS